MDVRVEPVFIQLWQSNPLLTLMTVQWFERQFHQYCRYLPDEEGWQSGCEFEALLAELESYFARTSKTTPTALSAGDYMQTKLSECLLVPK